MKIGHVASIAAFALGCAAALVAPRVLVPSARAGTTPERWEYHCRWLDSGGAERATAELNRAGTEGWELTTAASGTAASITYCFKRRLP